MDSTGWLPYLFLIVLIMLSAFFSASETAFSMMNKIRLKNMAEDGDESAGSALKVAENYEKFISTVLIGNNVVNIASASLATLIFSKLLGGDRGAAVSTVVMTITVLIFGEVLPKSYAKNNSDEIVIKFSGIFRVLMKVLSPLATILVWLTNLTANKNGKGDDKPSVTEEELKYIVESIEEEGVLEEKESDLVQSALEFDEIEVQEIITPRVDMITIDVEDEWEEIVTLAKTATVSRIPVYEKTIDKIIGVVHVRDILVNQVENGRHDIRSMIGRCLFVHKTMNISKLLENLRREKLQVAIVTDDYGGTVGLVTMEDVLEELVGEIWDEYDDVEEELVKISDDVYEVNGDCNVFDMMDELECNFKDFDSDYNTVSGWTLEELEHIPEIGEHFTFHNLRVTVLNMEEQRITRLQVEKLPEDLPDEEDGRKREERKKEDKNRDGEETPSHSGPVKREK